MFSRAVSVCDSARRVRRFEDVRLFHDRENYQNIDLIEYDAFEMTSEARVIDEKTTVGMKAPIENWPFDDKDQKLRSKTVLSWICGGLLTVLVLFVAFRFIYPLVTFDDTKYIEQPKPDVILVHSRHRNIDDFPQAPVFKDASNTQFIPESQPPKGKEPSPDEEAKSRFVLNPSHLCDTLPEGTIQETYGPQEKVDNPEVKLIILVTSATNHFELRQAIRTTWGSIARPHGPVRLGFVLGSTSNSTETDIIRREYLRYRDILQTDADDTYRNLTLKSVLLLRWVAEFCPHAVYFMKADDDTFVNVGVLAQILGKEPFASNGNFIGGYIHQGAKPVRDENQKYYVSEAEYPQEEYPPYAAGCAYVTRCTTAVQLYDASANVLPMLPMEDVFVTGLCGREVGADLIHDPRFHYQVASDSEDLPRTWQGLRGLAATHGVTAEDLHLIWEQMSRAVLEYVYTYERNMTAPVDETQP